MAKYNKPLENDEENGDSAKYRLPFALCKQRGIVLPKWATPRDAWNALKGYNINPDLEYKRLYEKKKASKKYQEQKKERAKQANDPEHSPDYEYNPEPDKIAGVVKGEPMTFEQADGQNPNPYYNNKESLYGYNTNCQTCVVAFEARLRGYDVRALPNNRNPYIRDLRYNTSLAYIDENGDPPKYVNTPPRKNRLNFLEKEVKEGNRYTVEWAWKGRNSGHIITVSKENGDLKFYDPQNGEILTKNQFSKKIMPSIKGKLSLLRVDNLNFDPGLVNYILKGTKK